ncbi:MAG: hypothetical protein ACREV0_01940 [Burkholderiales bacterium]
MLKAAVEKVEDEEDERIYHSTSTQQKLVPRIVRSIARHACCASGPRRRRT